MGQKRRFGGASKKSEFTQKADIRRGSARTRRQSDQRSPPPPIIIVRMRPRIWRDLSLRRQPNDVHGRACSGASHTNPQAVAACRCQPIGRILAHMGTKSRESIYGSSVRASAERAAEARKQADRLACEAWNQRMLGFQGPAQPSPTLGDALNAGYLYLEVKCLGCDTHQTVPLNIVRRPKATPIHELERYMRCKDCSQVRGYPYKRSHLVALRSTKISASDPPSTWWPGER